MCLSISGLTEGRPKQWKEKSVAEGCTQSCQQIQQRMWGSHIRWCLQKGNAAWKSHCGLGKQMTPEATLHLPAYGYTWRQGGDYKSFFKLQRKKQSYPGHRLISSHLIFAQTQQSVVFSEFCALIFCQHDVAALVGWGIFGGWDFCSTSSSPWVY